MGSLNCCFRKCYTFQMETTAKHLDFLAIGDITTDVFIRLSDAEVNCDENNENCKLSLRFGDKIPYESAEEIRAVGNSANASVCAARLSLSSALLSAVGGDDNGLACIAELRRNNVSTEYVSVEPGKRTNYHYVLWYDVDRTILVKQEAFTYSLQNVAKPKWIYLSSVGEKVSSFYTEIAEYLKENPEVKLAFQPSTFQIKLGIQNLSEIYKHTEVFICNVEEARIILNNKETHNLAELLHGIAKLGPKLVVITNGYAGAYAYEPKPQVAWFMPIYPHTPIERTGAGDAYASTLVSSLAMGKSLKESLQWAGINAMSVTQYVGAQKGLLSQDKIEEYLEKAPVDYEPRRL